MTQATAVNQYCTKITKTYLENHGDNVTEFKHFDKLALKVLKKPVPYATKSFTGHISPALIACFYKGIDSKVWSEIYGKIMDCYSDKNFGPKLITQVLRQITRWTTIHEDDEMKSYGDHLAIWLFSNYLTSDRAKQNVGAEGHVLVQNADVWALEELSILKKETTQYMFYRELINQVIDTGTVDSSELLKQIQRINGTYTRRALETIILTNDFEIDKKQKNMDTILSSAHHAWNEEAFDVPSFLTTMPEDLVHIDSDANAATLGKTLEQWQSQVILNDREGYTYSKKYD